MAFGINKLRQQNLLGGIPQIDMGYGMAPPSAVRQPAFEPPEYGPDFGGQQNQGIDMAQYDYTQPQSVFDIAGTSLRVDPPEVMDPRNPGGRPDLWEQINKIYTPETAARDRYTQLLDQFPERNDPSIGRKLVAGGLGWNAIRNKRDPIATMESTMYAPYMRDVAQWKEQVEPRYKAADLEGRANIQERTIASNAITAQSAADRLQSQQDIANAKITSQEKIAAERSRIAEIHAKANYLRARQYKIAIEGNRVIATNPNTLERVDLGDSGGMDKFDELNLRGEWNLAAAEVRAATDQQNIITRAQQSGQGVVLIDGKPYRPSEDGKTYIPVEGLPGGTVTTPGSAGAPPKAAETAAQKRLVLEGILEGDPTAREFIKGSGDNLRLVPPQQTGIAGFGKTSEEEMNKKWTRYKEILRKVNPQAAAQLDQDYRERQVKDQISTTNPVQEQTPPVPAGRIAIYKNGKPVGHITNNEAMRAEAVRQGYSVGK